MYWACGKHPIEINRDKLLPISDHFFLLVYHSGYIQLYFSPSLVLLLAHVSLLIVFPAGNSLLFLSSSFTNMATAQLSYPFL